MTRDFADFLAALNNEGVAYVVIGAFAVLSHVPYRTTRDLDVLIAPTADNAARALRAVVPRPPFGRPRHDVFARRRLANEVAHWGGFEPTFTVEDVLSGDILSFGGLLRVEKRWPLRTGWRPN